MRLRCPVCKAENVGPGDANGSSSLACRRCKADLSMAYALEAQHEATLAQARLALRECRYADAHAAALQANHLRSDQASRQLVALTALLCRDYALAWRMHAEALTS